MCYDCVCVVQGEPGTVEGATGDMVCTIQCVILSVLYSWHQTGQTMMSKGGGGHLSPLDTLCKPLMSSVEPLPH